MTLGILIMARAPRPGEVKTRLEPLLGPEGCARLQAELIWHSARWAAACAQKCWLAYSPAYAREALAHLVPANVGLFAQEGGDLGVRLRHATGHVFRTHRGGLAVIGTDAPELGPEHLRRAERELARGQDACLIPAMDGGYALIALARPLAHAFGLPAAAWGGPTVLDLTITMLKEAGCSWSVLEPVRDLDIPDDARYLAANAHCPTAIRDVLTPARAI